MAKQEKSKLYEYLASPDKKYKVNYSVWSNKYEFELVAKIRDRISAMRNRRSGNCYVYDPDGSKDWDTHWKNAEIEYLAQSGVQDADDYRSNLKSFMAYRTIAAIEARERRQDITFMVEARNEEDRGRATTHKYILEDYLRRHPEVRYKFFDVLKGTKIFGSYFAYLPYTFKYRKVQEPEVVDIKKEDLESGELPEMKYKDGIRIDYEDPDFIPIHPSDAYVDPNAEYLHGSSKSATDAAIMLYLTPSQVKDMFSGVPGIKNLDKVNSLNASNTESFGSPFFERCKDPEKGFDELCIYWNKETDSEVIFYGDILLKEGPIPYADKLIPLLHFRCIRYPGQFYGMSLVDAVIQQSAEDTSLKNARIDQIKMASYPPIIAGTSSFADVRRQWTTIEPWKVIEAADINQVKVLQLPGVPYDSFRISQDLKDEIVMNTGINPQGLNLPMSSTPATNTLAMKETMSDMVNLYEDNTLATMHEWAYLLESRICQWYKLPSKQRTLELGKKAMRELRLEDVELYKDKNGNWNSRDIKGYKVIDLEPEMFEWKGFPRVYVSGDFMTPISKAYKQRKAQEILPQLAPFAGEPGAMLPNGQPVVINIRKLVKMYAEAMDLDEAELLVDANADWLEEIRQALKQQEKMQKGEVVPGIVGEPEAHRYQHATELLQLNDAVSSDEFALAQQRASEGDLQAQLVVSQTLGYRAILADHLRIDSLLVNDAAQVALEQTDKMDNPQPEVPMNNMPSVPTVSGNQGLPNQGGIPVPNNMSPADMEGQVAAGMV